MALTNAYVLPTNRIGDILGKIRDGQAPERFTQQLLKDWGFSSTNDRAFIGLLKALGFLTPDGKPTQRYNDYRDHSRSRVVLGEALRDAYGDIFLIKEHPSPADRASITGKFKSFHNVSDHVAGLMTKTFLGLLQHADLSGKASVAPTEEVIAGKRLSSRSASSSRRAAPGGAGPRRAGTVLTAASCMWLRRTRDFIGVQCGVNSTTKCDTPHSPNNRCYGFACTTRFDLTQG
ncbi:DUF5343 domain-containing protein [Lysobacter sp. F60174L2]|uniref:DUF5343 domain-containing protein n=1 Tax=Lysobacter sp. F60174L2 TaxID=3459295 RepID=UPI00403DEDC8